MSESRIGNVKLNFYYKPKFQSHCSGKFYKMVLIISEVVSVTILEYISGYVRASVGFMNLIYINVKFFFISARFRWNLFIKCPAGKMVKMLESVYLTLGSRIDRLKGIWWAYIIH